MKDVEVRWEQSASGRWESALSIADARDFELYGFRGRQADAHPEAPAIRMDRVDKATIRNSQALDGANLFLGLDVQSRDVVFRQAEGGKEPSAEIGSRGNPAGQHVQ